MFSVDNNHATPCISRVKYIRSCQGLKFWQEKTLILEMYGNGFTYVGSIGTGGAAAMDRTDVKTK